LEERQEGPSSAYAGSLSRGEGECQWKEVDCNITVMLRDLRGLCAPKGLTRPSPGGRGRNFIAKTAFLHVVFRGLRPRAWYLWGLPGPMPRGIISGAYPAPGPGVHFCTHKSEPKKRQPPLGWTQAFPQSVPTIL